MLSSISSTFCSSLVLDHCPLYLLRTPSDPFGCDSMTPLTPSADSPTSSVDASTLSTSTIDDFHLPSIVRTFLEQLHSPQGLSSEIVQAMESQYPMVSYILQEAKRDRISVRLKSMITVKRGTCTFVEKARHIAQLGGDMGLMINTGEDLVDMPRGKENVTLCTSTMASCRESDGQWLHMSASYQEVLGVIADPVLGYTGDCIRLQLLLEDLLDHWPHSIPSMSLKEILQFPPPAKVNNNSNSCSYISF